MMMRFGVAALVCVLWLPVAAFGNGASEDRIYYPPDTPWAPQYVQAGDGTEVYRQDDVDWIELACRRFGVFRRFCEDLVEEVGWELAERVLNSMAATLDTALYMYHKCLRNLATPSICGTRPSAYFPVYTGPANLEPEPEPEPEPVVIPTPPPPIEPIEPDPLDYDPCEDETIPPPDKWNIYFCPGYEAYDNDW